MKKIFITILFAGIVMVFSVPIYAQGGPGEEEALTTAADGPTAQDDAHGQGQNQAQGQKAITEEIPLFEIKRLESDTPLFSIELRNVALSDFFRVIAHDYDMNFLIDKNVQGTVTASLTNVSLDEILSHIAQMHDLVLEKKNNVVVVKPHLITEVFVLKNIEARTLLSTGTTTSAGAGSSDAGGTDSEGGAEGGADQGEGGAASSAVSSSIYDLLSAQGKVLLGTQKNSIMIIDYPKNVDLIAEYIDMVDQGMTSKVFKLKYISARSLIEGIGADTEQTADEPAEEDVPEGTN